MRCCESAPDARAVAATAADLRTADSDVDELSQWLILAVVKVTWDETKNSANQKKHGISFEEARALLATDDARLDIFDELHSIDEDRFVSIGPIARGLIVVVWTERGGAIRLISARLATRGERSLYHDYFGVQ